MAAPSNAAWARPLLRAWRETVDDAQTSQVLVRHCTRRRARASFQEWSKSVPVCTRKWARLFSKLDFEHHQHATAATAAAIAVAASGGSSPPGMVDTAGVAKYFGASNAKELRKVFHEFMKDLTTDEREEMRFVLHAEAIRRGLGKYSITARRHSW
jgi:hypothetical protein